MSSDYADFRRTWQSSRKVVALAGAGLSAASGIPTFRGAGGLWRQHDAMSLATPEAFAANPALVSEFYAYRRKTAREAPPNAGHRALAQLAPILITQNVDGLSRGQGHQMLLEMHGSIREARCTKCRKEVDGTTLPDEGIPPCRQPGCDGIMRPCSVWFGEMPHHLDEIDGILRETDLFLVVGTSSTVYPAAGFAQQVKRYGRGKIAVFNLEPSPGDEDADFLFRGPCEETLVEAVKELSGSGTASGAAVTREAVKGEKL